MKTLRLWKSGVTVSLAASLLLSACGADSGNKTATNTPDSKTTPAASADVKPADVKKEKLALEWFITAPANSTLPDASKDIVLKAIQEKFNVTLKMNYLAAGDDYNTKINALLASTPPDMWRDSNSDGGNKYAVDGLLADLTNFVSPKTMPNYYKYWTSEDELRRYQIQGGFFRAALPYTKRSYRTYYIRKDWLDNLNLKIPTTYDEYVSVLKAFTFGDPDGNGKADTYGFSTSGGGANLGSDWPELAKHNMQFSYIEDSQFVDASMSPKMQNVLEDVLKVINEKVIDPDWYLNKSPQHIEKAVQGKIGVVVGGSKDFAYDNNINGIQYRTKQIIPKAEWQPFTMLGNTPVTSKNGPGSPFLFAKSVAEKNPEKVRRSVEILDWLASEEGYLLTHFGEEGKHYTKDGKSIKPINDAYTNDILKQGDYLRIWSFFTGETLQPEVYDLNVVDTKETDRDRLIAKFLTSQPAVNWIGTSLLAPQGFDLAGMRKRQNELFSKAIFEDKSANNWPQYRDELLNKYKAKELAEKYTQDLKKAGVIK
ncbi:MAG: hypothetical protein K0R67_2152 [Paenibacillus sp.]|nr:hypothetical protein [Paenibacillus sp.]